MFPKFSRSFVVIEIQEGELKSQMPESRAFLGKNFMVKDTFVKGSGTYGTVYLVEDTVTFARYAAKVETKTVSLGSEISLLHQFHHPHILPVLQSHIVPFGLSYFIMPLVQTCLSRYLRCNGALDSDGQRAFWQQLMNVLAYIHGRQVVHGDLKPGNFLLEPHKQHYYLADYGLAMVLPVPLERKREACLS